MPPAPTSRRVSRPSSPRPGRPAWRCSRSTSESCPEWSTRSAGVARARQPQPGPARPLRRGARGRGSLASHGRDAPRLAGGRQRVRPARGVGGDAGQDHVGGPRAGLAERRRHLPELRRAPALEHGPVRLPVVRVRAAGDAEPARRRHAGARRDRVPLPLALAGPLEPRQRRAGRDRGHDALRRRSPRRRRRRDDHHHRRGPVHDRRAPRRPARPCAARQEPGRMVGGAAPPVGPQ